MARFAQQTTHHVPECCSFKGVQANKHILPSPLWLAGLALLVLTCLAPTARAACSVSATNASLGTASSLSIATQSVQATGGGGLACDPALLSLLSASYIKARVDASTFVLTGGPGNQTIPFALSGTSGGPAIAVGQEYDFSSLSLLTLFSGPNNQLPLYFRTTPTAGLRAGTYTGTVTVRWYYSVCNLGLVGICLFSNSPGIQRGLLGGLNNWGSGTPAVITVQLIVQNDCAITAPNLSFGIAPLASAFQPATQTITIRCSAGAAYTVGLNDGSNVSAGSRRMRQGTSGNYLRYEIFKTPTSSDRWGSVGAQRRSSATADQNPGTYNGTTSQSYLYRAVVDPAQATPAAGTYVDSVIVDVQF